MTRDCAGLCNNREKAGSDRHGPHEGADTTSAGMRALLRSARGRRWKAATAASKVPAMRPNGGGRDRAPGQARQDLADPAGGRAAHEAGKDDPVDLAGAACTVPEHGGGAVAEGPRHRRPDVAGLARQAVPVGSAAAVAPVGTAEPTVDILRHPAPDDPGRDLAHRLPAAGATIRAIGPHRLHHPGGLGRLPIIAIRCCIGVILSVVAVVVRTTREAPLAAADT